MNTVWYSHIIEYYTAVRMNNYSNILQYGRISAVYMKKGKSHIITYIMTFFIKLNIFKDSK